LFLLNVSVVYSIFPASDSLDKEFIKSFISHYEFSAEGRYAHEYHPFLLNKTAVSLDELEEKLAAQAQDLEGNVVMTLGKAEKYSIVKKKQLTTYSFVTKELREELLNKAKLVVSRSGYSTIMDVAVVGAKALFIPTPGQIEQEYLSRYHNALGTFYSVSQGAVDLKSDAKTAAEKTGITRECDVKKTVEVMLRIIMEKT
jgi:UDP-N-acetylglucosamine transferase subunit ALG13